MDISRNHPVNAEVRRMLSQIPTEQMDNYLRFVVKNLHGAKNASVKLVQELSATFLDAMSRDQADRKKLGNDY